MAYNSNPDFARELDNRDPLRDWRDRFYIPQQKNGEDVTYFCGNSLGLQPKSVPEYVEQELKDWKNMGVEGHLKARHPWLPYHELLTEQTARIVGAKPIEVVVMNTLTVNLHLMMVSFYRPSSQRYKILIEGGAFPSDRYAVVSQLHFHGYHPEDALLEVFPRSGEHTLRTEDILDTIEQKGDTIALILLGGVNYYTGQLLDMAEITQAGKKQGCLVAFDLAHAVGNVPLQLHDWGVDFAIWCSYKYLNGGPGCLGGCFVHERYAHRPELPRFSGWWGHDKQTRFQMKPDFQAIPGAEGWQLSNPPILSMAALRASLAIFDEVGMDVLREKSQKLTGYLADLLQSLSDVQILTPENPDQRGSQLSLMVAGGKAVYELLKEAGIICDWREPNVIRIAPVPLYNRFQDAWHFFNILRQVL